MTNYGNRSASRLRTRLPARLITLNGELRVVLQDLSRSGAGLSKSALPRSGSAVLQWFGYEAFGAIRWSVAGQCGIEFDGLIPQAWVLATRSHDARERLPDDDEMVRRGAREWVTGAVLI